VATGWIPDCFITRNVQHLPVSEIKLQLQKGQGATVWSKEQSPAEGWEEARQYKRQLAARAVENAAAEGRSVTA